MASARSDAQAQSADQRYRALLAVSEAIVSHRDLSALFHELACRLHQVVRFDYLPLCLHEATSNTMRVHVLEVTRATLIRWHFAFLPQIVSTHPVRQARFRRRCTIFADTPTTSAASA